MKIRTQLKARGLNSKNHNETVPARPGLRAGTMRKRLVTTSTREDRLVLLVVRAGLRAGGDRGRR